MFQLMESIIIGEVGVSVAVLVLVEHNKGRESATIHHQQTEGLTALVRHQNPVSVTQMYLVLVR